MTEPTVSSAPQTLDPRRSMHPSIRVAFVVEQALGHRTHGLNLRESLAHHPSLHPEWAMIPWETEGWAARVPLYARNWTVRSGLRARRFLAGAAATAPLHALFFHTQVPAMLCLDWLRRVPTILSLDATPRQIDELGAHYDHTPGAHWQEYVKHLIHRRVLGAAAHIVAWSEWTRHGLIQDYGVLPEKISVIPPGIDTAQWRPPERSVAISPGSQESIGGSDDVVRILFVGGNFSRKGGNVLIAAFIALRARFGQRIVLDIVTADAVPEQPGVRVHHGLRPNSEALRHLFHSADLFCLPTLGDCLPLALAEAGAAGLPAVTTRLAAIPELLQDGETGLLVPPNDVSALARALETLITDSSLRRRLGRHALEHTTLLHDVRGNALRVASAIEAVVGRAGTMRVS
jgi:glycosyltransferase involved in cell wall biosynthesis